MGAIRKQPVGRGGIQSDLGQVFQEGEAVFDSEGHNLRTSWEC